MSSLLPQVARVDPYDFRKARIDIIIRVLLAC